MILVVDIGNSNVVIGVFKNGQCVDTFRIRTIRQQTMEYYQLRLTEFLLEADHQPLAIEAISMSSVVPDLTSVFEKLLRNIQPERFLALDHRLYGQLNVSTSQPHEMGTDLMANAIAAHQAFHGKKLIVDFGTALTFTLVMEDGSIGGVNIVPGIKTAIRALSKSAAQLHTVPIDIPDRVLGQNTVQAIQAGVIIGYRGLVIHMIETIRAAYGPEITTVATGGLAGKIPGLGFDVIDKELTLKGLYWVAENLILGHK
jgi:type III pantothenate kinase